MGNSYNPGPKFQPGSPYGKRQDPFTKQEDTFHSGTDFRAPQGTEIPAAAGGQVIYSGYNAGLGNTVIIRNDNGTLSLYGHLMGSRAPAEGGRSLGASMPKFGERVEKGQTIGLVGSTGARTTGPHLHYSELKPGTEKEILKGQKANNYTGGKLGIELNKANTVDPSDSSLSHADDSPLQPGPSLTAPGPVSFPEDSLNGRRETAKGASVPSSVNGVPENTNAGGQDPRPGVGSFSDRWNALYSNPDSPLQPNLGNFAAPGQSPFSAGSLIPSPGSNPFANAPSVPVGKVTTPSVPTENPGSRTSNDGGGSPPQASGEDEATDSPDDVAPPQQSALSYDPQQPLVPQLAAAVQLGALPASTSISMIDQPLSSGYDPSQPLAPPLLAEASRLSGSSSSNMIAGVPFVAPAQSIFDPVNYLEGLQDALKPYYLSHDLASNEANSN